MKQRKDYLLTFVVLGGVFYFLVVKFHDWTEPENWNPLNWNWLGVSLLVALILGIVAWGFWFDQINRD